MTESFTELYECARTSEQHEQQFRINSRPKDPPKAREKKDGNSPSTVPSQSSSSPEDSVAPPRRWRQQSTIKCHWCGEPGHFQRDCPNKEEKSEANRSEAPEKSPPAPSANTATVGAAESVCKIMVPLPGMSVQQLEAILSSRWCSNKQGLLGSTSVHVGIVHTQGSTHARGATLELDVKIEGVKVEAMVDTGAQSSIISRPVLHNVGIHMKKQGKPVPKLEPACVKHFGKDGRAGSHELNITAQVTLTVEADGVSIPVVLFVHPDSSQPCLLGMNAAPALGLKFLDAKGQPLRKAVMDRTGTSTVSLITCKAVPARAQSFIEAEVSSKLIAGSCVLFEPVVNYHQSVIHLGKGTRLEQVELVKGIADDGVVGDKSDEVAGSIAVVEAENRKQHLLDVVRWPEDVISEELDSMKKLVAGFDDVFALRDDLLGL